MEDKMKLTPINIKVNDSGKTIWNSLRKLTYQSVSNLQWDLADELFDSLWDSICDFVYEPITDSLNNKTS